jgi:hypothetical protein
LGFETFYQCLATKGWQVHSLKVNTGCCAVTGLPSKHIQKEYKYAIVATCVTDRYRVNIFNINTNIGEKKAASLIKNIFQLSWLLALDFHNLMQQ